MTGTRGPLPKPAVLRLLEGNAGKRPLDLSAGVNPTIAIPSPPKDLRPEAKKVWRRLAPHLENYGLISELDVETFGIYCQAVGDLHYMDRAFNAKVNLLVDGGCEYADAVCQAATTTTPSGYEQQSVRYNLIKAARSEVNRYAQHFGLSPALRGRVQPSNNIQLGLPGVEERAVVPTGFAMFTNPNR